MKYVIQRKEIVFDILGKSAISLAIKFDVESHPDLRVGQCGAAYYQQKVSFLFNVVTTANKHNRTGLKKK